MPRIKRSFTVKRKLEIVIWYRENSENYHAAEREFDVSLRRICEWNQNYATLLAKDYGNSKFKRKLHDGAKPFSDLLDAHLLEWLLHDQIPFEIDDEDELWREAIDIQFDDEGDDSDLDFDGFDENELQY